MTGVVLCGGQSTRMGFDKGLLEWGALTWVELSMGKLAAANLQSVLSLNDSQYKQYINKFTKISIITDDDSIEVNGPLKGILSVYLQMPSDDLLVLACDMPSMDKEVLKYLINESSKGTADAFVFEDGGQIEPLCAIYTARGLGKIYRLYEQKQLKKHSLHYVLENVMTCYLPIAEEWKKCFTNYNSPSDLNVI